MKKVVLIILLGSVIPGVAFAQSITFNKKIKFYQTWIYQHKDTLLMKGFLYELKDSSIVVLNKFIESNHEIKLDNLTEIPIKKIELIKTRNKKGISTGTVAGIFCGLGLGLIAGALIYEPANSDSEPLDRLDKGAKVVVTGIASALVGGVIGAVLGSSKYRYEINKNWNDYMLNGKSMLNKSILYQLQN